ncbi:MAG: glucose-6-phosphate 1-dehydrogenase [Rhodothermales bacterium]|jgi:glucose-6-phosphate 1-dehydrogenase
MSNYRNTPCNVIIVGASGDLTKRKLIPALYSLFRSGVLPEDVNIFGFARSPLSREDYLSRISAFVDKGADKIDAFLERCHYHAGSYDNDADFAALMEKVESISPGANTLVYMAIPPSVFVDAARSIGAVAKTDDERWLRVVIEKPFGRDSRSSRTLMTALAEIFTEEETYRIDHYLGKEVIQNLMVLRFANRIFEPIWNRDHIESVSISWSEEIGCEGRAGYFDSYGIIRDVLQNHLLQIVALIGMEQPLRHEAEAICDEKVKMLKSLEPLALPDTIIGRYEGYRDDPDVPNDSRTETYVSTVLHGANPRWHGVPFYLEAGKALSASRTEIRIKFRDVPYSIYRDSGNIANELLIRVQPAEAIELTIANKRPGHAHELAHAKLDLHYKSAFNEIVPDAYERLLLDVIRGDRSLFIRDDELAVAWDLVTPLLDELEASKVDPEIYAYGSKGPKPAWG